MEMGEIECRLEQWLTAERLLQRRHREPSKWLPFALGGDYLLRQINPAPARQDHANRQRVQEQAERLFTFFDFGPAIRHHARYDVRPPAEQAHDAKVSRE